MLWHIVSVPKYSIYVLAQSLELPNFLDRCDTVINSTICHNMNGKKYGKYIFITALSVILGFAICISVMLYKEWQQYRRTDIASTTIIIQDGVAPNDLSEYTWTGSSDGDVPLTNNTETPNDNTNNNTDLALHHLE